MNHVKYTGMEDKVETLNHSIKTHDWNTQKLYDSLKKQIYSWAQKSGEFLNKSIVNIVIKPQKISKPRERNAHPGRRGPQDTKQTRPEGNKTPHDI